MTTGARVRPSRLSTARRPPRAGAHRTRGADHAAGQALVEFAFVLPIFLFLLMILIDFGRIVYAQHTITQDAREAARLAAVPYPAPKTAAEWQAWYTKIRQAGLRMSPGVGLTPANITGEPGACSGTINGAPNDATSPTTCFYPDGIDPGDRVVVNIQIVVPLITPIISNVVGGSYTLTAQSIGFVQ
jgi:Flp pilus assembly protein TadG